MSHVLRFLINQLTQQLIVGKRLPRPFKSLQGHGKIELCDHTPTHAKRGTDNHSHR